MKSPYPIRKTLDNRKDRHGYVRSDSIDSPSNRLMGRELFKVRRERKMRERIRNSK